MRRVIPVLLIGGGLLAAAACGTAQSGNTTATAPSAPVATAPPAVAATCEALAEAYGENMAPYAKALHGLIADRKATAPAQQALAGFATAVQDATKASGDEELRIEGKEAADKLRAKSADAKFFAGIKTTEDVNKAIGPTLTEWLAPVHRRCS
ncbi:hypothetical protein [Actinoplanes aureus]|uniref:Lipoprotein n=1 Tax=Actinoplanes aureus TaxID=2792083 RepID=A0A931C8V1_9ACTN|nr:hypothetical protein [Actinoplanes aureus]MBG0565584.1 hypothetical protein [Actinoplanes aureus]